MTKAPFLQVPPKHGDPFLATVKEAAQRDRAKGTGPKVPKPNGEVAKDIDNVATSSPDLLHSALHAVGDELEQHQDKRATLSTIGVAFKRVADRIKPPSGTGEAEPDTRGLLSTPAPEAM